MSKDISNEKQTKKAEPGNGFSRRDMLFTGTSVLATTGLASPSVFSRAEAQQKKPAPRGGQRPNILVIMGDDIGQTNVSAYSFGLMGYKTPTASLKKA
jgi:hypothetical protein